MATAFSNSAAGAFACNYVRLADDDAHLGLVALTDDIAVATLDHKALTGNAVAVRRNALEAVGGFDTIFGMGGIVADLLVRIAISDCIEVLPEPIYTENPANKNLMLNENNAQFMAINSIIEHAPPHGKRTHLALGHLKRGTVAKRKCIKTGNKGPVKAKAPPGQLNKEPVKAKAPPLTFVNLASPRKDDKRKPRLQLALEPSGIRARAVAGQFRQQSNGSSLRWQKQCSHDRDYLSRRRRRISVRSSEVCRRQYRHSSRSFHILDKRRSTASNINFRARWRSHGSQIRQYCERRCVLGSGP